MIVKCHKIIKDSQFIFSLKIFRVYHIPGYIYHIPGYIYIYTFLSIYLVDIYNEIEKGKILRLRLSLVLVVSASAYILFHINYTVQSVYK